MVRANYFCHISGSKIRVVYRLVLVFILSGCDSRTAPFEEQNIVNRASFIKSIDGKLSERQVADYIVIRKKIIQAVVAQRNTRISEGNIDNGALGDGANYLHYDQIEKSSAASINMGYDEFSWIKNAVIDAQTTLLVQRYYELNDSVMSLLDKTLVGYRETNLNKPDQENELMMRGYVDEIKQEIKSLRTKTSRSNELLATQVSNMAIITRFRVELDELERQAILPVTPQ